MMPHTGALGEIILEQLMDPALLTRLRCPVTRGPLRQEEDFLVSEIGALKYPITDGIPRLLAQEAILPADSPTLEAFKAKWSIQPRDAAR